MVSAAYLFLVTSLTFNVEKITAGASIDPFSKSYWEEAMHSSSTAMNPPRAPLNAMKSTSLGLNGPNNPVKMFPGLDHSKPTTGRPKVARVKVPHKPILADDMPAFRQAVAGSNLTKIGLVEVLHKQFPKNSRIAVQSMIEAIATRIGPTKEKRWVLNENLPA